MIKKSLLILILTSLVVIGCKQSNPSDTGLYDNYTGTLIWGGSPAVDGVGMVFETGDKTYGVEGDRSDYDHIFNGDSNNAEVIVDFYLTNEKTVRGWGVTFKKIEIISIERLKNPLE